LNSAFIDVTLETISKIREFDTILADKIDECILPRYQEGSHAKITPLPLPPPPHQLQHRQGISSMMLKEIESGSRVS
jgi:hypothetical protein